MEKIENTVLSSIDLLEVAKAYCEYNSHKSDEIMTLVSLIDIIINKQKEIMISILN